MPLHIWLVSTGPEHVFPLGHQLTHQLDAVPKKRGPKTDVLEALLKRVDGLEAKLREKNASASPTTPTSPSARGGSPPTGPAHGDSDSDRQPKRLAIDTNRGAEANDTALFSPIPTRYATDLLVVWCGRMVASNMNLQGTFTTHPNGCPFGYLLYPIPRQALLHSRRILGSAAPATQSTTQLSRPCHLCSCGQVRQLLLTTLRISENSFLCTDSA